MGYLRGVQIFAWLTSQLIWVGGVGARGFHWIIGVDFPHVGCVRRFWRGDPLLDDLRCVQVRNEGLSIEKHVALFGGGPCQISSQMSPFQTH